MAENIFQGAKRIKEETEEVLKALEGIKELKNDLKELSIAFDGVERLKGKLEGVEESLDNLEQRTKRIVENQVDTVMDYWKLWALFLPAIILFISIIGAGYIYFTSVRSLKEQNEVLTNRIISIYHAQVLEDKYWYDKKNKKLFLQDYKWIEEQIKKERESNKKK
jgi:hypothetical protein